MIKIRKKRTSVLGSIASKRLMVIGHDTGCMPQRRERERERELNNATARRARSKKKDEKDEDDLTKSERDER